MFCADHAQDATNAGAFLADLRPPSVWSRAQDARRVLAAVVAHLELALSKHAFIWGIGVGWLSGYADSAIASSVITTLLTLFAGGATAAAARQRVTAGSRALSIDTTDAAPITAAVIGVVIGYPLGLWVRAHFCSDG